jgi:hypothetical protein
MLAGDEVAGQVHIENLLPNVERDLNGRSVVSLYFRIGNGTVVVQNVEPTEVLYRPAHHRLDAVGLRAIELQRQPVGAERVNRTLRRSQMDIGADDLGSLLGKSQRRCRTNPTTTARDDGKPFQSNDACRTL